MIGKMHPAAAPGFAAASASTQMDKKTTRRGNYESGSDYVLEYGELRFAFNEEDFAQRVEQAAVKLAFVDQGLSREELDDLLDLAVSGEIAESGLRNVRRRAFDHGGTFRVVPEQPHGTLIEWEVPLG